MTESAPSISTVIGVFPAHEQANDAIDGLRQANFSYERIRLVEHGTGSFFDTFKSLFNGKSTIASNTPDNLKSMGMPEYEAQYYQRELDAEHVLVLMNADERPEEAFNVMRQSGAFDIQSRLRTIGFDDTDKTFKTEESSPTSHKENTPTPYQSKEAVKPVNKENTPTPYQSKEAVKPVNSDMPVNSSDSEEATAFTNTRDTSINGN